MFFSYRTMINRNKKYSADHCFSLFITFLKLSFFCLFVISFDDFLFSQEFFWKLSLVKCTGSGRKDVNCANFYHVFLQITYSGLEIQIFPGGGSLFPNIYKWRRVELFGREGKISLNSALFLCVT